MSLSTWFRSLVQDIIKLLTILEIKGTQPKAALPTNVTTMPETTITSTNTPSPITATNTPVAVNTQPNDSLVPWVNANKSENNRHNVRVLCDLAKITLHQKNVITACVEQESDFNPIAVGKLNTDGTQDFGIAQYNNGKNASGQAYWIGPGAPFASVQEVESNPEKCINLMISLAKQGMLHLWASYSTKAYLKFMPYGDEAPF